MSGLLTALLVLTCGQTADATSPKVLDPRLKLELFAQQPDLVTPVGLSVDAAGRVFVVESHTHFPPPNYAGPKADRIRLFEDTDADGKADRISTFYEGLKFTMNLAVYRDGSLFVATRSEILRLTDKNNDGVADEVQSIAKLKTAGNYPHNGLSGFAFDFAGRVYFGFGENLGADYELVGADGKSLAGGGEGGNVYRCDPDGKNLHKVATGFWNPFHLCFDAFGRLFVVDNDPDSRPPCRLLHIVEGGDYGYRFRNGRRGTHPFTAWNGELPNTLPMVAGTGEAPSGIVAYESDQWPEDYRGDLLVTSWGDHRLDRFRLRPRGASFAADSTPIVVGDENFRPVGVTVAPDGSVFFTDWVDKSYELHGKGRLWKLSSATPKGRREPDSPLGKLASPDRATREAAALGELSNKDPGIQRLTELLDARGSSADSPRQRALGVTALAAAWSRLDEAHRKLFVSRWTADPSPDVQALALELTQGQGVDLATWAANDRSPLVRAAAYRAMKPADQWSLLLHGLEDADPFIRQAATDAIRRSKFVDPKLDLIALTSHWHRVALVQIKRELGDKISRCDIPLLLTDTDAAVRFVAVQWIGEERLTEFRGPLEETLRERANTRLLFEGCLAALEMLDNVARRPTDEWQGEQYVLRTLLDEKTSLPVRRQALRTLRPTNPGLTIELLQKLLAQNDPGLRLEAIRSLREHPSPQRTALLIKIAEDDDESDRDQAEAVMGLNAEDAENPAARRTLIQLACRSAQPIAMEALRGLRGTKLTDAERKQLADAAPQRDAAWRDLFELIQQKAGEASTGDVVDTWLARLEGHADPEAGERIFFHARATQCYRCHEYDGRGAGIGPELTRVTSTMTRRRLVESLVDPSREIAPQFVPWMIETVDGKVLIGLLAGEEVDGTQRYIDQAGVEFRLKPAQIAERRPHDRSIMPSGLPALLTPQEFRDLVAFLTKKHD